MAFALGVDIGGTFTDVVLIDEDGVVETAKGLSTPQSFERGILDILAALLERTHRKEADNSTIVHGTTVATNAIIERRGAVTGLVTTKGFRDVLELRRIRVPSHYDLTWVKPVPLVERYLRREVVERIDFHGKVHTPLDPASVSAALRDLKAKGVSSIAVCLLNAYANAEHEEAVRAIIAREAPEIHVSLSSEILPEMREYERTSTTVINSYIMPVVKDYVAKLDSGLKRLGFAKPLLLMQSNGGSMAADVAAEAPVHIIESGPAAGVVASQRLARELGIGNAVTLDIGGTTAKASLIEDGNLAYSKEYEVGAHFTRAGRLGLGGGYVVRAPTLDISEIGAGGGSIVSVDSGGALKVGPQSAGADPGPACYGRGGTRATLGDACLLLGYLSKAGLAGGEIPLHPELAEKAFAPLAAELGLELIDLAHGVFRIAVANMTRAIRSVSIERGKDPRDFDLIAFGGNGGLFAAAVARELELPRVVVPPAAGIFSAFGLLYSDLEHHLTRTHLGLLSEIEPEAVDKAFGGLEEQARAVLEREGYRGAGVRLQRFGELRYRSQTSELSVPWPEGRASRQSLTALGAAFEDSHERTFGHRGSDGMVELVNLHLVASGIAAKPRVPARLSFEEKGAVKEEAARVYDGAAGWTSARISGRQAIGSAPVKGPVLIREFDTTVFVPPDFTVWRDERLNLLMARA